MRQSSACLEAPRNDKAVTRNKHLKQNSEGATLSFHILVRVVLRTRAYPCARLLAWLPMPPLSQNHCCQQCRGTRGIRRNRHAHDASPDAVEHVEESVATGMLLNEPTMPPLSPIAH